MHFFSLLSAILVLTACAPRLLPAPTQLPSSGISTIASSTVDPQVEKISSLVIQDLSTRLDLDASLVHLLTFEFTRWEDTALGCPLPEKVYVQQAIPGYQFRLEAKGQEYVYHTDTDKTVILCAEEELPSFPVTPGVIDDGQPWMPVN